MIGHFLANDTHEPDRKVYANKQLVVSTRENVSGTFFIYVKIIDIIFHMLSNRASLNMEYPIHLNTWKWIILTSPIVLDSY